MVQNFKVKWTLIYEIFFSSQDVIQLSSEGVFPSKDSFRKWHFMVKAQPWSFQYKVLTSCVCDFFIGS